MTEIIVYDMTDAEYSNAISQQTPTPDGGWGFWDELAATVRGDRNKAQVELRYKGTVQHVA
jgi:hypothetical protein